MSYKDKAIILSQRDIEDFAKKVASMLDGIYNGAGSKLVLVPLLQGAIPFFSEITKNMTLDCLVDAVGLSSYSGKVQGEFNVYKDFSLDIKGKHIWLIDDIADSGNTIKYLTRKAIQEGALTVNTCTMLKRKSCAVDVTLYRKVIDKEWCVGFGMDDAEGLGRTLNDIIAI